MIHRTVRTLALSSALFVLIGQLTPVRAQGPAPKTGAEVLGRMRAAYAGKWYHTLTFVQKTTLRLPSGKDTVQTWYESLRHTRESGTRLRIDIGQPSGASGIIYTADSSYGIRNGKPVPPRDAGNEFLPMIEGVYVQPVERTVRELAPAKFDMSRVMAAKWEGRDAWVVGATSATDTTSAQFWVDAERNVVVRMIMNLVPGAPPFDVRIGKYVPLGGGWLGTKIEMFVAGRLQQSEEYTDWKADVPLDPALFDPAQWSTAKHWAKPAS